MDDWVAATRIQQLSMWWFPIGITNTQLNLRDWQNLLESEAPTVPEIDRKVVATGGNQILFDEVLDSQDASFMGVNFVHQIRIVGIVNLEPGRVLFDWEQALELLEIVHVLDVVFVFFLVHESVTQKIAFDEVFEAPVVSKETQLDDVVGEFLPLHGSVAIDIDFLEQFDESQCHLHLELFVVFIKVQMFQHNC